MKALIAFVMGLSQTPQAPPAPTWICKPDRKVYCDAASCREVPPVTWSRFNMQSREYSRCDQAGCDTYPDALFHFEGAFATVTLPSNAMMMRLDEAMNYTEVAALGLGSFICYGSCEEDPISDQ